jgi:hypothetical protein
VTETLVELSLGKSARQRGAIVVLLLTSIVIMSGCAERRVHAANWSNIGQVRPNPPVVRAEANADIADIAADLAIAPPENGTKLFSVRPMPARPRVESPRAASGTAAPKSSTLVPELSPQEAAAAQEQFSESVAIAEKNLGVAKGKNLSTPQADVVAKINAFLTEAREAGAEGDWGRARNLAKKAQILSEDLAAAF